MEQAPDQRLATAIATGRISDRGGADGQQHQSFTLVSPTASEDGVEAEQDAELGSADGHIDSQTPAEAQSGESGEGVGAGAHVAIEGDMDPSGLSEGARAHIRPIVLKVDVQRAGSTALLVYDDQGDERVQVT